MAITFSKSGYLRTPLSTFPAVDQVSLSFFLRINTITTFGMFHDVFSGGGVRIYANGGDVNTQQITLYGQVTPSSGAMSASKAKFSAGVTYHVAIVYDRYDPSRQFFAVNGIKFPFPAASSQGIASIGTRFTLGNNSATVVDDTVQDVLILRGYAFTDDDLDALMDVPGSSATVGAGSGASRAYWSCRGEVGAGVVVGDPGIVMAGNPSWSFDAPLGLTTGASIAYSAPLEFVRAATEGVIYVASSGKGLVVPMLHSVTGSGLSLATNGLITPPSIRINGGPPVVLPTSAQGAYGPETSLAIYFPFPSGVEVEPGDAVTISAPKGWAVTEFGALPELEARPVSNRAGRPSSQEAWPPAETPRIGVNIPSPTQTYYDVHRVPRNLAYSISPSLSNVRPDGTFATPVSPLLIQINPNWADNVGAAFPVGLFAVRWDSPDPARPTTVALEAVSMWLRCTELTAYRNEGVGGIGKVRVFEVAYREEPYTLKEAIDASTTTLRLNEPIQSHIKSLVAGTGLTSYDCYITIDGETIRLGTRDGTSDRMIGCTRGWDGTTAAPHAAGSGGLARHTNRQGIIRAAFTSTSGQLRYENLAILGPGNWTPPAEPGPVVIPPVPWDDLDADFLAMFAEGSGITRFMDSTPTFREPSEVEHVVVAKDPHWGTSRWKDELRIAGIRPFDTAVSPYVYTPTPGFGAETYQATLTAPLGAAESGAVQTIAVAESPSDPLLYGSRLMADGETMRVVAILGGGQFRVVRGVEGTTPAPHAAGPISVGWRIRLVKESQYTRPERRFYEVLLAEDSSPPRLAHIPALDGQPSAVDSNVTARRVLTLPDGVNATAVTFRVLPADPGDWFYLAKGLTLVVDAETMTVVSADRGQGTITVSARGGGVAHAAGATGRTQTNLALFQNADGSSRVWKSLLHWSGVVLPTGPRSFVITGDLAADDGQARFAAGPQVFDPAKARTTPSEYPKPSLPYEMIGRVLSLSPEGWGWINVPMPASDDLVRHIATAVRDNLPANPRRRIFIEMGNEIWNGKFKFQTQGLYMDGLIGSVDSSGYQDWWILRQHAMTEIIRAVFAERGRGGEIKSVLCNQIGRIGSVLSRARRLGISHDAISMAPYVYPPKTADYIRSINACDDEQVCDLFATHVEYGYGSSDFRFVNDANMKSLREHKELTGEEPLIVYYEGDLEQVVPNSPDVVDGWARGRDVRYNPAFLNAQRDSWQVYRKYGKIDAHAVYCLSHIATDAYPSLWGMLVHPRQKPGYGDGRDGGVDNRLCKFRPGVPGSAGKTRGPDSENVSVRAQAWLDVNREFFAQTSTPPDPDPGTDPGPGTDPPPHPHPEQPGLGVMSKPRRFVPVGSFGRSFRGYR